VTVIAIRVLVTTVVGTRFMAALTIQQVISTEQFQLGLLLSMMALVLIVFMDV
jgi:hypothetical protein